MRKFFTKRKIIWAIVIVVLLGLIGLKIAGSKNNADNITTEQVQLKDLKSTVVATGKVTSSIDLDLSFKGSGIVRRVNVKVGNEVKAGQLLANIDQKDELASVTSARAAVASAQANYQKLIDGSSSEEIAVARVALDNAIKQQDIAVENAYRALLNTGLVAEEENDETGTAPTISGAYTGTQEGFYKIRVIRTINDGYGFNLSGLESIKDVFFDDNFPESLGTKGLLITFPGDQAIDDTWIINIPNKKAANYVTNFNAYQAALRTRDATVAAAQANLDLELAKARPADLQAAQASILSAQGQLQAAQAALESTEIRAPSNGTITKADIKVGEVATALTPVITIQDVNNLYLEANISESNIDAIKMGQKVNVTFDALGLDKTYTATVMDVDPASTLISGVINYKVTAILDPVAEIKPGMTANMSILTGEKTAALAIPSRALVNKDGKKYVRVITDTKTKKFEETEVSTGFEGDGGLVEITNGLEKDQEIVTAVKE